MILGTKARYAVMAMVELAGHAEDRPVSLAELAAAQGIDAAYLEQIFSRLRAGGLVVSARGPGGGYRLSRAAGAIRISEIVQAADESLKMTRCSAQAGGCMPGRARCLTHDLWEGLEARIFEYLHSRTLEQVREGRIQDSGFGIQEVRLSSPESRILNPES